MFLENCYNYGPSFWNVFSSSFAFTPCHYEQLGESRLQVKSRNLLYSVIRCFSLFFILILEKRVENKMFFNIQLYVFHPKMALFTYLLNTLHQFMYKYGLIKYKHTCMLCNDTVVPVGGSMALGFGHVPLHVCSQRVRHRTLELKLRRSMMVSNGNTWLNMAMSHTHAPPLASNILRKTQTLTIAEQKKIGIT